MRAFDGQNRTQIEQASRQFLRGVTIIPMTRPICSIATGSFAAISGSEGWIISDPDIMIAAIAMHRSLTLVTQNLRHFQRIPGLTLYQPHGVR